MGNFGIAQYKDFKHFIDYNYDDDVTPLLIRLPK